ncbi:Regulatory protein SoxS [compost metagenome]
MHHCQAHSEDPFRYFYVGFNFVNHAGDDHSLAHIRKMFDQTQKPVVSNKLGIDVLFVSIFNELINLKSYSSFMIGTYLRQIIVLAYRSFHDSWATEYSPQMKDKGSSKVIYEVINYIDKHLHQITELRRIADEMHYSYSYLSHIFSKEVGLTIKEYYNRKRFEKAIEWLQSGEMNVTQIAAKLQYQSIHTFSKAFRKNFGISPTEYQTISMNSNKVQQLNEKG